MGFWNNNDRTFSRINPAKRGASRNYRDGGEMHDDVMDSEEDNLIVTYTETSHGTAVDVEWEDDYRRRNRWPFPFNLK